MESVKIMKNNIAFNVGYYKFHEDEGLNFQLNRFYTYGAFSRDELMAIAGKIDGFEKWISLFREMGEEAEKAKETLKAATCYRAAQFYTLSDEKDADGKYPIAIQFFKIIDDKNSLPCAKTVCLQNVRSLQSLKELAAFLYVVAVECLVSSSRDVVTLHECLCKVF